MAVFHDIKTLLTDQKNKEVTAPPKQPEQSQSNRLTVLVVEDDTILQNMYKDKLTHEGFAVFTADNGEQGLEIIKNHKPRIVLLDLMMPVMDGKTMLRRLREIPEFKFLPVLVLTNAGDVDSITETKRYGNACEFLIKSNIGIDDVVKRVKFWL